MKKESILDEIKARITNSKLGSIFVASDFIDIAKAETVNTMLSRLVQSGMLRRIKWGLYEFPEYNDFLGEYIAPSADEIAHALARNFDWKIAPSGENALNQLGLSAQVPASLTYASNGVYREYQFGNTQIKFKKASNRDFASGNEKIMLVIQALKALGKKNVSETMLAKIVDALTAEDMKHIKNEAQHTTAWVRECIYKLYERRIGNEEDCQAA